MVFALRLRRPNPSLCAKIKQFRWTVEKLNTKAKALSYQSVKGLCFQAAYNSNPIDMLAVCSLLEAESATAYPLRRDLEPRQPPRPQDYLHDSQTTLSAD